VVSPLLANIALHGMEAALGVRYNNRGQVISPRTLVRYADDLVVLCPSVEEAEAARATLDVWLGQRGLRLSGTKTRIVHVHDGFDFLGYNVRRYPAPLSARWKWRLIVKPSQDAVARLKRQLKEEWRALRGHPARAVAARLNPIIQGWANYHRAVNAKETFSKLDHWLVRRSIRHVRRRHPTKPWAWLRERYFQEAKATRDRWLFCDPDHPRSTGSGGSDGRRSSRTSSSGGAPRPMTHRWTTTGRSVAPAASAAFPDTAGQW
jgi:RNA-directed DNA polymerase